MLIAGKAQIGTRKMQEVQMLRGEVMAIQCTQRLHRQHIPSGVKCPV